MNEIKSYRDLIVWQKSKALVKMIYGICSELPKEETYGLSSQMKRAAISIPSNIAEGKSRGTKRDYRHFLLNAFGSGAELETQLELSKELGFTDNISEVVSLLDEVMRMLNSLISKLDERD